MPLITTVTNTREPSHITTRGGGTDPRFPCTDHRQNECRLAQGVELADDRGAHFERPDAIAEQQRAGDDHHIPRHRGKHQPQRHELQVGEHDEDRRQQHFVGHRIEDRAEIGAPVKTLGQETVGGIFETAATPNKPMAVTG